MGSWLEENLICPVDHTRVHREGDTFVCAQQHSYPSVDGIPVMLVPTESGAATWAKEFAAMNARATEPNETGIDPFVQQAILATNGIMYRSLIGKLTRYPIPTLPLPEGNGRLFLDVGCNWGRWSLAAAKRGYRVVGIDPSVDGVRAAQRVAKQLGIEVSYVVADATRLPFADATFDVVHSYGVLQHLDKPQAARALVEAARTLKKDGLAVAQLANIFGLRNLYNRAKRSFRPRKNYECNYYTPAELERLFSGIVGPTTLSVDGYFTLNSQTTDVDLLPLQYRLVVQCSSALRELSTRFPPIVQCADSLYVTATRSSARAGG